MHTLLSENTHLTTVPFIRFKVDCRFPYNIKFPPRVQPMGLFLYALIRRSYEGTLLYFLTLS